MNCRKIKLPSQCKKVLIYNFASLKMSYFDFDFVVKNLLFLERGCYK